MPHFNAVSCRNATKKTRPKPLETVSGAPNSKDYIKYGGFDEAERKVYVFYPEKFNEGDTLTLKFVSDVSATAKVAIMANYSN